MGLLNRDRHPVGVRLHKVNLIKVKHRKDNPLRDKRKDKARLGIKLDLKETGKLRPKREANLDKRSKAVANQVKRNQRKEVGLRVLHLLFWISSEAAAAEVLNKSKARAGLKVTLKPKLKTKDSLTRLDKSHLNKAKPLRKVNLKAKPKVSRLKAKRNLRLARPLMRLLKLRPPQRMLRLKRPRTVKQLVP